MKTYSPAEPYGAWFAYHGSEAITLAVVLAAVAILFAVAGARLKRPIALKRPGWAIGSMVFLLWLLSMLMLFVALRAYGIQLQELHIEFEQQKPQIGTFYYAWVVLFIIAWLTRKHGGKTAWYSGFFGAAGAVMLFELPFDLIIMARVFPPVAPEPGVFRALFFGPLFMWEVSTLALLAMSPAMRITRGALFALAGMFAVWGVWAAAFGFAYPVEPGPWTVNVISKLLAFAAAVLLFVWKEPVETRAA
jgi:hypothetical protein